MSLSIDRFLTVRLLDTPSAVQTQDQSLAIYVTDQYSDQFIDALYLDVSSQSETESIFGTAAEICKATAMAFSHPMKPRSIRIVYWNKDGDAVAARANSLTATQTPLQFLSLATSYDFTITSRNVTETVTYTAPVETPPTDHASLAAALNTALGVSSRFVIAYANGVYSVSSKVVGVDVDTDNIAISGQIADDLRLTSNRGAIQIRGLKAIAPVVQTPSDLISRLDDETPNFYGFYVSATMTDAQLEEFDDRLQSSAKPHVFAFTAQADYMLDYDSTNPLYRIATKNNKQMLVQLNKAGEKHAAVQLLVEACSTNWEGNNTAKTMKFKRQPMVSSDANITTTMANKADRLGINYYTDYDGVSFLAEGRTVGTELFFIDSKVGRDAYVDRLRAAAATRLIQQPKIPQTDEGQVVLEGALLQVHEQFVRNGFLGQNLTWNGASFGELNTGDIMPRGYYMYSDSYTLQSQSDREARKAMPIQVAAKEAGAIHSAEILVMMER